MGWYILFFAGSILIAYIYGGLQTTFSNEKVGYVLGLVIGLIIMIFIVGDLQDRSGGNCQLGHETCGDFYNP